MRILTPQQVAAELARGTITLLDVRQPEELELARVAQATHLPMGEVPARIGELNAQGAIAVLCHHGARSLRVAEYLEQNGFGDVVNVAGGIDAWSEMDPAVPRY